MISSFSGESGDIDRIEKQKAEIIRLRALVAAKDDALRTISECKSNWITWEFRKVAQDALEKK